MREKVGFKASFKLFWSNYFNFKGRSRRSEYWFMQLWHLIFLCPAIILMIIGYPSLFLGAFNESSGALGVGIICIIIGTIYILIYSLATIIPNLAILARRFHDTSRSMLIPIIAFVIGVLLNVFNIVINASGLIDNVGVLITYYIIALICLVLGVYNIVVSCLDSKNEGNQYGPSPKYEVNEPVNEPNYNPVDKAKLYRNTTNEI